MAADVGTAPPAGRAAALAVGAGGVGVVLGVAGALVYRHGVRTDGGTMALPWGIVFTLATLFAVTVAAGRLARGPGAIGVAIGWVVALLWLDQGRPEGDALIHGDALGAGYVFGGMLTVGVAVVRGMTVSMADVSRRREGPPA